MDKVCKQCKECICKSCEQVAWLEPELNQARAEIDDLIMIWGIFSKQTRKRYIEQFYPQYLETEEQTNATNNKTTCRTVVSR